MPGQAGDPAGRCQGRQGIHEESNKALSHVGTREPGNMGCDTRTPAHGQEARQKRADELQHRARCQPCPCSVLTIQPALASGMAALLPRHVGTSLTVLGAAVPCHAVPCRAMPGSCWEAQSVSLKLKHFIPIGALAPTRENPHRKPKPPTEAMERRGGSGGNQQNPLHLWFPPWQPARPLLT